MRVLPECDAALFVVSADPPITEIEIEYLARIRQTVARLIIVLNKIDVIELQDREKAATFLRTALVDHAGLDPVTSIFTLSARDALRAKESGNPEAFAASGFAELEKHLVQFLANEKRETLNAAVARKAVALVAQLQLETEIALKSLRLPVEDLEQRMATFDDASETIRSRATHRQRSFSRRSSARSARTRNRSGTASGSGSRHSGTRTRSGPGCR